jgi:hypothetical protein
MRLRQSVAGGTAVFPKGRITGVRENAAGKAGNFRRQVKAAHCLSVGETENTMSVFKSKRALALVLAIVMAMSVFAVSAYATSPSVGVSPDPNDQLWYLNTGFTDDDQWFDGTINDSAYAHDTLQEVVIDSSVDPYEYVFVIHPQYYHDGYINYEDPTDATKTFAITNFKVWNENGGVNGEWVDGLVEGGTAVVPVTYSLSKGTQLYLRCQLEAVLIDLVTGVRTELIPNLDNPNPDEVGVAYLLIPDNI